MAELVGSSDSVLHKLLTYCQRASHKGNWAFFRLHLSSSKWNFRPERSGAAAWTLAPGKVALVRSGWMTPSGRYPRLPRPVRDVSRLGARHGFSSALRVDNDENKIRPWVRSHCQLDGKSSKCVHAGEPCREAKRTTHTKNQ